MGTRRTAYELSDSQVVTPESAVNLFWRFVEQRRDNLGSVLDLGAGDCRFGNRGSFRRYVGVEIDKRKIAEAKPPANGTVVHTCAFRHDGANYDACIGNPPYARHHDIESDWKEKIVSRMKRELNISLNRHCNLYIYFLCLALIKSHENGLVALLIPYEWVSRPSAKAVREFIQQQKWNVFVYRFQMPIGVISSWNASHRRKLTPATGIAPYFSAQ